MALEIDAALAEHAVSFAQASVQLVPELARNPMFGDQAGGHTLKVAAHRDGIGDLRRREQPHDIAPGRGGFYEALLLQ